MLIKELTLNLELSDLPQKVFLAPKFDKTNLVSSFHSLKISGAFNFYTTGKQ